MSIFFKIKSIFKCQMCWFYSKRPLTNYMPHGYSGPFCFHYMLGCLGVTPGNIHCHCISSTLQVCLGVQPLSTSQSHQLYPCSRNSQALRCIRVMEMYLKCEFQGRIPHRSCLSRKWESAFATRALGDSDTGDPRVPL